MDYYLESRVPSAPDSTNKEYGAIDDDGANVIANCE